MNLGEKLRTLRQMEGTLRGLGREMTQQEMVARHPQRKPGIDQPVLSVADREWKPPSSDQRHPVAAGKFFKVHPGYLVDDPEVFIPN